MSGRCLAMLIALGVSLVGGCGRDTAKDKRPPAVGTVGGHCFADRTCNPGLMCSSQDLCVEEPPDPCAGVRCSGLGQCVDQQGVAHCLCPAGYRSSEGNCVLDRCYQISCSHHGTCVDNAGQLTCDCDLGFVAVGMSCAVDPTAGCDLTRVTNLADLPVARRDLIVSPPRDGFVYIMGGSQGMAADRACSAQVFKYDLEANTYQDLGAALPYGMCGGGPATMAWGDNNRLYLSPALGPTRNNGWGSHRCVVEFNPESGAAVETPACFPISVWNKWVVNGGNGRVYFFGGWTGSSITSIHELDPSSYAMVLVGTASISGNSLDGGARGLLHSNGKIYFMANGSGGNQVAAFDVGSKTFAVAATHGLATVSGIWEGENRVIYGIGSSPAVMSEQWPYSHALAYDPATNVVTTRPLSTSIFGSITTSGTQVDRTAHRIYAWGGSPFPDDGTERVSAHRTECLPMGAPLAATITLTGRSILGLAYDRGVIWTVHAPQGTTDPQARVSKLDAGTGELLAESAEFDWDARGIAIGAGSLWITDASADVIYRLDRAAFDLVGSLPTPGTEPGPLAWDGSSLWHTDPVAQRVYEISPVGGVVSSFTVPNSYRSGLDWEGNGLWLNTGPRQLTHYVAAGSIDETRAVAGIPEGFAIYDLAVSSTRIYISIGADTIYVRNWTGSGRQFAPGVTKVVAGANRYMGDLFHGRDGTLVVATHGEALAGEIWVSRSVDQGNIWTTTNLGDADGNRTYHPGLFAIDAGTMGVTGTQGATTPYDLHVRYSMNTGTSYNGSWVNVSNSADLFGPKQPGAVLRLASGHYLAVFARNGIYRRLSSSLDSWAGSSRVLITTAEPYEWPALATDGTDVWLLTFLNGGFAIYISGDQGASFSRRAILFPSQGLAAGDLWYDQGSGHLYLCAATAAPGDVSVVTYRSLDRGLSWGGESLYVTGLQADQHHVTCHLDGTGVYVGYRDVASGETRVVLPSVP